MLFVNWNNGIKNQELAKKANSHHDIVTSAEDGSQLSNKSLLYIRFEKKLK
jgi:hypothetical protein